MTSKAYLRTYGSREQVKDVLKEIGVDPEGLDIMSPKALHYSIILKEVNSRAANIIKQEFLSKGGEAALAYHCLSDLDTCSDMLLMATERQYRTIIAKFRKQPFGLAQLADTLENIIDNLAGPQQFDVKIGGGILKLGGRTTIMGILNVTPDSFSDGGEYLDHDKAIARGLEMVNEGANFIDIGGESTRPGAQRVEAKEELQRVIPVIEGLAGKVAVPISIDTTKPEVAKAAIEAGAGIINDVSGLSSKEMITLAVEKDVPVIIMHMQGEPRTMQEDPQYEDVVDDIVEFFRERVQTLKDAGIGRDRMIIDPGIGFGKTLEHNLEILKRLDELRVIGLPIMIGASRKSFIGALQGSGEDSRMEGSLAAAVIAAQKGAAIVRVHDVKETKQALAISNAVINSGK